jgi:hypothetical protein
MEVWTSISRASEPRICQSILRFEIISLSCSSVVKLDRQEIIVMFVTGLDIRSTSRAGTSETPVISVHRLALVTLRGVVKWKCCTLRHAGSNYSPDLSFEDIDPEVVE